MLCALGVCLAQEPASPSAQDQEQGNPNEPVDQQQAVEEDPIPVPVMQNDPTRSLGAQTFVDDIFQNLRNRWGLSLGAHEGYTTDAALSSQGNQDSSFTSATSRVFFNFGKRKSKFHVDTGAGYRFYNGKDRKLNNWGYYGDALYSKEFSERTSFLLSNQFTSSYNDSWSFLSFYSPVSQDANLSNEIVLNRQRITRNVLTTRFSFQATRKIGMGLFADYNLYRYTQSTQTSSDAFEVGAEFNFELTKWLYFSSSYSTYLNNVDANFQDARIQRLQVIGLGFRPTRHWRVWANGGIDYTDYHGASRFMEDIYGGASYNARNFTFNTTYQHSFTSAIGISSLLTSDIVHLLLGYRVTNWARIHAESYYYRSTEQSGSGLLKSYSGGGGLEFMLSRNFFLTARGFLQNQSEREFSVEGLAIRRVTLNVGLQYVLPSRKLDENIPQIWGVR
jgi:hypothetical protein